MLEQTFCYHNTD